LPAVDVGNRELELERERLPRRAVRDLVEAVVQRLEGREGHTDRHERADHRHCDRRVELGSDRHAASILAREVAVLPFYLLRQVPDILWVSLVVLVYLAWVEVRREPDLTPQWKLWWCLLVFLLNFPAYIVLRVWVGARRRRRASDARA
jgi:hypothetical protein